MRKLRLNVTPLLIAGARFPLIDELRGLALLLVICYHGGGVLGRPNALHGEIGVDLFLMVSGLTLALSSVNLTIGQFFRRRLLRIYPAYWLAMALFLWMHRKYLGVSYSGANITLHILGLHAFAPQEYFAAINDSFWFISLIIPAYIVFAAVRKHLDNFSLLTATGAVLTTIACIAYQETSHNAGLIHLAVRIPSFFIGMIAGRLLGTGTMEIRFNFPMGLGLLCFFYLMFTRGVIFAYALPAVGLIITWIAVHHLLVKVALGRWLLAAMASLGVIAYEVYLFHQPLIRDYNLFVYHVWIGNLAPTTGQVFRGMLLALTLAAVISLIVHWATNRLFSRDRR